MPLYSELKTRFASILNRDDLTAADTDGFFQDAVDRINSVLRVEGMKKEAQPVFTSGAAPLPADYLETEYIYLGDEQLVRVPLDKFIKSTGLSTSKIYVKRAGNLYVKAAPADAATVDLYYYAKIDQFGTDGKFTALPGAIFIYGALSFAADHFLDERVKAFEGRFLQLVAEANAQAIETEMSEGPADVDPVYYDLEY